MTNVIFTSQEWNNKPVPLKIMGYIEGPKIAMKYEIS